ncbi:MAG: chorismate mutase [Gemmatimonadaceae bacterium]
MSEDAGRDNELAERRAEIHEVDRAIIELLARRVVIGRQIGKLKRDAGLPVLDPGREAEVIRAVGEMARAQTLPSEPVREIFWRIVALSRQVQWEEDA